MKRLPELGQDTVVRLSRQGGFAAMSMLSRPREIDFAQCDPGQRGQICSLLEGCLPLSTPQAGQGDQRYYKVELRYRREDADDELVLRIPEERAPGDLVRLWDKGQLDI
ncbi:hypothetical protein DN824_14665 [Stutzerimonas nosocomialis]|uniref:Uncharacterized protein n=1 Tax=Stutzerimonas nosocomialis TaxID=1056496 RepID=A0A5R9QEA0_9GAMM|nr:protealysin inhibitor emfourin [Stutzerimonas nosocomialis]TLX56651.1 hypothetical protein DN824_14665 [Stutzerimonas nosocomialis]TLX59646.1 hypothetical protein DN826_02310 [Stutzerimonas nosocomialis]TLX63467.1 hypothetical protein DN820_10240 [Stutzerimonas nosocomialis]